MNKSLAKFLKKKGLLGRFIGNASKSLGRPISEWREWPLVSVGTSFAWYRSEEGHEFWQKISEEWDKSKIFRF